MGFKVCCHLVSILRITGFISGRMGVEVGAHNQEWIAFQEGNCMVDGGERTTRVT